MVIRFEVTTNDGENMHLVDPTDATNTLDYSAETLEEVEWLKQFPVGALAEVTIGEIDPAELTAEIRIDPPRREM